jgi:SAM-dependent methyltransferase
MEYFETVEQYGLYPEFSLPIDERRGLDRMVSCIFENVKLSDTRALDVGAGNGLFSLYMATEGADVVALEPEGKGTTQSNVFSVLSDIAAQTDRLTVEAVPFQACDSDEPFDVILLRNVVNHLDEAACKRLHKSDEARNRYRELFRNLFELTASDGTVLIADADRTHFYQYLGLDNPFAGNIEWEKHQSPGLWAELLQDVGFVLEDIGWTPAASLGPLAPLTRNYIVSHFLRSHFRLVMRKPSTAESTTTQ